MKVFFLARRVEEKWWDVEQKTQPLDLISLQPIVWTQWVQMGVDQGCILSHNQ